jgi:hypothetical protein
VYCFSFLINLIIYQKNIFYISIWVFVVLKKLTQVFSKKTQAEMINQDMDTFLVTPVNEYHPHEQLVSQYQFLFS